AGAVLSAVPAVEVDYLQVRGVDLGPAPAEGQARLLIAARLGATRLIDNAAITLGFPADDTSVGSDGYPAAQNRRN
ncbi:MAG: pantoate--beta-alanine ligase, partial [Mycolicibacter algericus]